MLEPFAVSFGTIKNAKTQGIELKIMPECGYVHKETEKGHYFTLIDFHSRGMAYLYVIDELHENEEVYPNLVVGMRLVEQLMMTGAPTGRSFIAFRYERDSA